MNQTLTKNIELGKSNTDFIDSQEQKGYAQVFKTDALIEDTEIDKYLKDQ